MTRRRKTWRRPQRTAVLETVTLETAILTTAILTTAMVEASVIWWLIPLVATLGAWLYLRLAGSLRARRRRRPEPGSPRDAAELARFAEALGQPLPGAGAPSGERA